MPTRGNTSTRLPIGELFLRRNVTGLIHPLVFPEVPVDKKTGKFYVYDKSNLRAEDDTATARGGTNEIDFDYTTANFDIKSYGNKSFIDGDVYDDADPDVKALARSSHLMRVKDNILIKKEKRLADLLFSGTTFSGLTTAVGASARWNATTSDPIAHANTAESSVLLQGGVICNTLIIGYQVMLALRNNEKILSLCGDKDNKIVTVAMLEKFFSLNGSNFRVLVGAGTENTGAQGQTASFSYIWGKGGVFCYIDPSANTIQGQTLGKTFKLKTANGGDKYGFYKPSEQDKNGEWAWGTQSYQHNVVDANCGYYFSTLVD